MAHKTFLRKLIPAILLLITLNAGAQSAFTVKYFGLTIHPFGDKTASLQPYRLDDKARFVLNFGGFAGYEKFLYKDLISVKVIQGLFTDCSAGWASVTHLGGRMLLIEKPKHALYLGIGPTLLLRNSWTRFGDAYEPSGYFNIKSTRQIGDVQYKLIWYGCEFEYDYSLSDKNKLSVSFTPGVPLACTFAIGWKHWINKPEFDYNKIYIPGL